MSAKPEGRPSPISSKMVVSPKGQARLTLVMYESDVSECNRCSSSRCRQKVKTIDAEMGLVKCTHKMPVAQVDEFRFGTPAVPDQLDELIAADTDDGPFHFTDADAIDETAAGVFAALRAEQDVYLEEDETGIDNDAAGGAAVEEVMESLALNGFA
jgi:hypothetical protein